MFRDPGYKFEFGKLLGSVCNAVGNLWLRDYRGGQALANSPADSLSLRPGGDSLAFEDRFYHCI